jgi:hypothetical protein
VHRKFFFAMAEEIAPRIIKLPHVIKEGYIHKEGHNIKKMKTRWFKLVIDMDCNPVLEYFDEIDTDRRLGMCNLSACVMNKPKNLRPPFSHCLRIDLNDHAMNSFVKLVLGWDNEKEEIDWIAAFKTASALIMAHRKASMHSSGERLPSPSDSHPDTSSPAAAPPKAAAANLATATNGAAATVAVSSPQPSPAAVDGANASPSAASPSLSGSGKAYQRRGSVTVGNAAAAEKRDQEKAEADAEKRALLDKVAGLASSFNIEQLVSETEQKLDVVSREERFNPRKQTLEDALSVMKERLSEVLRAEAEERAAINRMEQSCEAELKKFTPQASMPSDQRSENQIQLGRYMNRLADDLREVNASRSPSSALIQAFGRCIEAVSSRSKELQDFENKLEAKLSQIKAAKEQLVASIGLSPFDEALQLKSHYEGLLSEEPNPEVQGVIAEILTACSEKLATEERLDKEAVVFVQTGASLKKYARDKVIKKSKHEPAPSIVKSVSGVLLWGSHKTGPKIHDVAIGPSQLLAESGILGSRSVNFDCDIYYLSVCSFRFSY